MRRRLFNAAVITLDVTLTIGHFVGNEARWLGRMGASMWRSRFPRKAGQ